MLGKYQIAKVSRSKRNGDDKSMFVIAEMDSLTLNDTR